MESEHPKQEQSSGVTSIAGFRSRHAVQHFDSSISLSAMSISAPVELVVPDEVVITIEQETSPKSIRSKRSSGSTTSSEPESIKPISPSRLGPGDPIPTPPFYRARAAAQRSERPTISSLSQFAVASLLWPFMAISSAIKACLGNRRREGA